MAFSRLLVGFNRLGTHNYHVTELIVTVLLLCIQNGCLAFDFKCVKASIKLFQRDFIVKDRYPEIPEAFAEYFKSKVNNITETCNVDDNVYNGTGK